MTLKPTSCAWKKALPEVAGKIRFGENVAPLTWFNVGGPADAVFRPADVDDLAQFLTRLDPKVPVLALGAASNLLVRDGGIRGVVVILGKAFEAIDIAGNEIIAGAAAPDVKVASAAARAGLTGLEFLRGVPGTIGGAVAMNAGAYGGQISDALVEASIVTRGGEIEERSKEDLAFSYRTSAVVKGEIVVEAKLSVRAGNASAIRERMQEIARERADAQPVNTRTGGSTFKNPADDTRAWKLIDDAGCRGLQVGGARVSEKHCNFIENVNDAMAEDIESLVEEVEARVKENSGVTLEREIVFIGERAA